MQVDYLIVGQGIAGSVLSYRLLQAGKSLLVIGKEQSYAASLAAAGICNPVTGRKLQKTWLADQLFPELARFYRELEQTLGQQFFWEKAVYRAFNSVAEQNEWSARAYSPEWQAFVNIESDEQLYRRYIDNPLGGWETKQSYYVDTDILLPAYRQFLQARGAYREAIFDYEALNLLEEGIEWQGVTASKVIFCEGFGATQNPFFSWLPFAPVKGEWIEVQVPHLQGLSNIINKGFFMLPTRGNILRVGATYEWDQLNGDITEAAKKELLQKLDKTLRLSFQFSNQRAGVRPATQGRRPIIGVHPKHPSLAIFNGLGTKGLSLAPYLAKCFVEELNTESTDAVPAEAKLQRFANLA